MVLQRQGPLQHAPGLSVLQAVHPGSRLGLPAVCDVHPGRGVERRERDRRARRPGDQRVRHRRGRLHGARLRRRQPGARRLPAAGALSAGRRVDGVLRLAGRGRRSGFSGTTRTPPRFSWATSDRWRSARALGTVAILIKQEILLVIVGGVFVLEILSVVLQVGYFKATGGQRLFRMAPLHHHFELIGWSEPKVITRFVITAIVFALFSLTTLKLR